MSPMAEARALGAMLAPRQRTVGDTLASRMLETRMSRVSSSRGEEAALGRLRSADQPLALRVPPGWPNFAG
jgi:hypothetical protein